MNSLIEHLVKRSVRTPSNTAAAGDRPDGSQRFSSIPEDLPVRPRLPGLYEGLPGNEPELRNLSLETDAAEDAGGLNVPTAVRNREVTRRRLPRPEGMPDITDAAAISNVAPSRLHVGEGTKGNRAVRDDAEAPQTTSSRLGSSVERTGNKLEQPDSHIVTGQAGKYLVQDDRQRPESQLRPQTELPERIDLVRDAPAGIAESDPDTRLKQVESGRSRGAIESDPLNQRGVLEVRPRAPKNIVEPGSEVARPERDGFLLHETNSSQKPRQEPELQVPRIQVTIGRVEVRAVYSPQPRPAVSRPAPSMTLDDYLKQREAGS